MRPLRPILSASLLLVLAGCGGGADQQQGGAPPPPEVSVMTVRSQPVTNVVELPGRVQAFRIAEVRSRVDGIVQARVFDEGSDVRAGAVLFRIDPREFRATLSGARASLARARATLANAQAVVRRYQPLLADGAVSRQEYDAAVAAARTAEADVQQNAAQVETAQLGLGYSTVTAPISGRVGRAAVTEGAYVTANQAEPLTRIEQIDRVYVNFGQSSSDLLNLRQEISSGRLNLGNVNRIPVNLILEDGTVYGNAGFIDFFDLSIDETTGTAALRAEFTNSGRMLIPGQFVRARIQAGTRPGGIVVPQRAVQMSTQGGSVMVVGRNNVAEARPVRVGDLQGGSWVVLSGLREGDRVIVDGAQKVQPGQPVRIAAPGGPPPSAGGRAPTRPAGQAAPGTQAPGANAPGGTAPQGTSSAQGN